jgi:hypothetical protein
MSSTATSSPHPDLTDETAKPAKVARFTDEPSPAVIDDVLMKCEYWKARTRLIGFKLLEPIDGLVLKHPSREEPCDEKGAIVGFDLTPIGEPINLKDGAIPRRIGADAVPGLGWDIDHMAEHALGDRMKDFFDKEIIPQVARHENESYNALITAVSAMILDGKAKLRVYKQHCGIKIGIKLAPMDTEERRIAYAKLLRESNGNLDGRASFAEGPNRWIVTEPYDAESGAGYLHDDEGTIYGKDEFMQGRYFGTAIYNKPEHDAELHWLKITYAEAMASLAEHGKLLPNRHIMWLAGRCAAIP